MDRPQSEKPAVPPLFTGVPTFKGDLLCPRVVNAHYRQARWHALAAFYADGAILDRFTRLMEKSSNLRVGGYRRLYDTKIDSAEPAISAPKIEDINLWRTVTEFDWSSFYMYDPPTGFFLFKDQIHFLVLNDAYGFGSQLLGQPLTLLLDKWTNGKELLDYSRDLTTQTGLSA